MIIKDWMISNPKLSVIIISFAITLIMTLITKKFTNQDRMKELKDIQKACQIKVKENKNDPTEMQKIQKQMMECSLELMKHSFKPMIFTFLPLIVLFWWIRGVYSEVFSGWLWWYIGSGIVASLVLRKALKVV